MNLDPAEARVLAALDARRVPYQRVACDPSLADTAAFCAHYGYDLAISANAIVVATRKEPRAYAACLVLATTRLDVNRAVRRELGGAKVSFATAEEMRAVTGMEVGGVTPFALPQGFPLLIDAAVARCDRIIVGTGGRTSKVLVPSSALVTLPGARVVEGLANPVVARDDVRVAPSDDPVSRFCIAFGARDVAGLGALLAPDATAVVVGSGFPTERGAEAILRSSIPHMLGGPGDPPLTAEPFSYAGRRCVLFVTGSPPQLDTLLFLDAAGGLLTRLEYLVLPHRPDEVGHIATARGIGVANPS